MVTVEQINSIHNLQSERWSLRRIARQLRMDTRTVKKYLQAPVQTPVSRPRASKLDTFKSAIDELLEKDPRASTPFTRSSNRSSWTASTSSLPLLTLPTTARTGNSMA